MLEGDNKSSSIASTVSSRLCLNRTNGKDIRVRLRTSSFANTDHHIFAGGDQRQDQRESNEEVRVQRELGWTGRRRQRDTVAILRWYGVAAVRHLVKHDWRDFLETCSCCWAVVCSASNFTYVDRIEETNIKKWKQSWSGFSRVIFMFVLFCPGSLV